MTVRIIETAISISVIGIIAGVCIAAPTTTTLHDQRQVGELNVAADLRNIFILISIPSSKKPTLTFDNSELADYISMLDDRGHSSPAALQETYDLAAAEGQDQSSNHGQDSVDDDISAEIFSNEDDSSNKDDAVAPVKDFKDEGIKEGEKVPKARNLWGGVEDVVDNGQGASSSWGLQADRDETSRSSDHNEVGLVPSPHLTLLGSGIEDCGPDRHRNSYGICASLPSK